MSDMNSSHPNMDVANCIHIYIYTSQSNSLECTVFFAEFHKAAGTEGLWVLDCCVLQFASLLHDMNISFLMNVRCLIQKKNKIKQMPEIRWIRCCCYETFSSTQPQIVV